MINVKLIFASGRHRFMNCRPISTPSPTITSTNDSSTDHQPSPYDLGALRALFRHIRAAYDEHRTRKYDGMRVMSAPSSRSQPEQALQGRRGPSTARAENRLYTSGSGIDASLDYQGAVDDTRYVKRELGKEEDHEGEGTGGGVRVEQRQATPRAAVSRKMLDMITRWVSELQLEMRPRDFHEDGDMMKGKFLQLLAVPAEVESGAESYVSMGMGQGGCYARLVIIKELQPIPNHAPRDVVPLLELVLDQQQVNALFTTSAQGSVRCYINIAFGSKIRVSLSKSTPHITRCPFFLLHIPLT